MKDKVFIFLHLQRSGGTTLHNYLSKEYSNKEFIHIGQPWIKPKNRKPPFEKRPLKERMKSKFISGHKAYYDLYKLVPNKRPLFITILRDPAERLISIYNKQMSFDRVKIPFEKWYESKRKNELLHFFYTKLSGTPKRFPEIITKLNLKIPGTEQRIMWMRNFLKKFKKIRKSNEKISDKEKFEKVKKFLDECWWVGITERLDKDLSIIFKILGIKEKYNKKHGGENKIKRKELGEKLREKIYKENSLDFELYRYALKLNKKTTKKIKKYEK